MVADPPGANPADTAPQWRLRRLMPAGTAARTAYTRPLTRVVSHHYLEGMTETRQRMSAEERREMVLEAAVGEFAVRGLAGTSTEDVARRAGISQPYLFRLFPTKKALFLALVDRCFHRVQETFAVAAGDRTGDEALAAMAESYERLLDDRTLLLMQMQAYAACGDPEIRMATRAGYKHLWELVERLTGLPFQQVVDFFAVGMLMNVAAAMDLPAVDERWTSWCPKD
jgi:AcrR family transcriptional regulator